MTRMGRSKIVFLGTGTPNADPSRFGPALAIVVDGRPYLVDAGPGVVRRAAAACERGIRELNMASLNRVFITHLHSDHTAGLADLILGPWVLGRPDPLVVYGPPGIRAMTSHLLAAYAEDIRERTEGMEPLDLVEPLAAPVEITPGKVFAEEGVAVEAFRVHHGAWPAYGYRFATPDRVIVVSGDTAPFEGIEQAYSGCDVLIHEVHSEYGLSKRAPEWRTYHRSMHTSTIELAKIAAIVRPKLLVLTHQIFHGSVSEDDLVAEVRAHYEGRVVSAHDLDVF